MEGAGSRQSRAASRYASSPSPAAFNGRVRRWRKQWVSNNQNTPNKRNHAAPLLLCRWTPLPAADEPPTRRPRYAPIVPIKKEEVMKKKNEASIRNQLLEPDDISKEEEEEEEAILEINEDEAVVNKSVEVEEEED